MSARKLAFVALVALGTLAAACASEEDELPLGAAEKARNLPFLEAPQVRRQSRASFLEASARSAAQITEQQVAYVRGSWGRLGFLPSDFDVRSAFTAQAMFVGAFYSAQSNVITLFEDDSQRVIVHELVHALQDQHFDLAALDAEATSSDEALAKRALVEGDATLAEKRFLLTSVGEDPVSSLAGTFDRESAREFSEAVLARTASPAVFVAYPSFAYGYGARYAATRAGLTRSPPTWDTKGLDAAFVARGPVSTQEVMAGTDAADPVVDTGLTAMPARFDGRLVASEVDRLGEWYIYLLLRRLSPAAGKEAEAIASGWDGDQLVVLVAPDDTTPRGVLWTTAWEDAEVARRFRERFQSLQGMSDGEPVLLEQRGARVAFVRGLDAEDARALATAALGEDTTRARLPVKRSGLLVTLPTSAP